MLLAYVYSVCGESETNVKERIDFIEIIFETEKKNN